LANAKKSKTHETEQGLANYLKNGAQKKKNRELDGYNHDASL